MSLSRAWRPVTPSSPANDAPYRHLRVAAVVDEFTRASLAPEVKLFNLDARLWPIELARFRPDLIFVESAWRGAGDSWKGKIASYEGRRRSRMLSALRLAARAARIPTAFWNKEDPVHFDRFIDAARGFDFVFSTAREKLDDYRRVLGLPTSHVAALPFGVQPRIYSPPQPGAPRSDAVVFAGSFGESHFPERRRQLEMLLDGALEADGELVIFDRTAVAPNPDKAFPTRFRHAIRGSRDYRALADEYRRARVGLNVNSVTGSETMFSRRVFEMLACGLPVVSGPGRGIEVLLPGMVRVVSSAVEARDAICSPIEPDPTAVIGDHSMARRLEIVARAVGLSRA